MFIYRKDDALRHTLDQLQTALAAERVGCRLEHHDDGPWLILDGDRTDMSVTLDPDGMATSVWVQMGDDRPDLLDALVNAFERLGWEATEL